MEARGPEFRKSGELKDAVVTVLFLMAGLPCFAGAGEGIFNWEFVPLGAGASSSAVVFTTSLTGLAGFADGSVFLTGDGGDTWRRTGKLKQAVVGISARSGLVAVAGAKSMAVSRDAGSNFNYLEVPGPGVVSGLAVDDESRVWLCTTGGQVLACCGQAGEWKAMSPAWPGPLFAVAAGSEGRILAGGVNGLWEKGTGSSGWRRLPESALCKFVFVAGDLRGELWPLALCGETARLYRSSGKDGRLRVVHEEPETVMRGADVSEYGMWMWTGGKVALHSGNGRNWKRVPLPAGLDSVKAVTQAGADRVWAAGAKGGLFRGSLKGGDR